MKFKTTTGTIYEIIGREQIQKNGVFMYHYALLGSIEHEYVDKHPKPHITDIEKLISEPKDFQVGQHLIFEQVNTFGESTGKIHITAQIKKIKRGLF
jgi:hypothetical protein